MNLFLLRHGKACARGRKWIPDGTRPLTREGEKKMFEVARGFKTMNPGLELILTSPYIRAFRTAEILCEVLETKKFVETKNLMAEALPEEIVAEIKGNYADVDDLALVGHEPFLSRLISILLTGKDSLHLDLRKGGMCKLSIERLRFGSCATLDWLMTPKQLARLPK